MRLNSVSLLSCKSRTKRDRPTAARSAAAKYTLLPRVGSKAVETTRLVSRPRSLSCMFSCLFWIVLSCVIFCGINFVLPSMKQLAVRTRKSASEVHDLCRVGQSLAQYSLTHSATHVTKTYIGLTVSNPRRLESPPRRRALTQLMFFSNVVNLPTVCMLAIRNRGCSHSIATATVPAYVSGPSFDDWSPVIVNDLCLVSAWVLNSFQFLVHADRHAAYALHRSRPFTQSSVNWLLTDLTWRVQSRSVVSLFPTHRERRCRFFLL